MTIKIQQSQKTKINKRINNYFDRGRGSLKIKVDYLRNVSRFVSSSGYYAPFSLNALSTPLDFLFHVPADCHQICTNTPGSYSCSCFGGYQLSSDGKSCLGESLGKTLVIPIAVCCRSIVFLGPKNMQCTRILIFLNPQLFLCRFGFRPYVRWIRHTNPKPFLIRSPERMELL